jgi:valyl-tRNA synthetase
MFEGVRRLWAEARANSVAKQVDDILQRYQRMPPKDRFWVFSGFNAASSEVENQLGSVVQWSNEQKKQVAKQIMLSAQRAFTARGNNMEAETTQLRARGAALLSHYLELQTLPGDRAANVAAAIENWRAIARNT